jgi:hypothetical protein
MCDAAIKFDIPIPVRTLLWYVNFAPCQKNKAKKELRAAGVASKYNRTRKSLGIAQILNRGGEAVMVTYYIRIIRRLHHYAGGYSTILGLLAAAN